MNALKSTLHSLRWRLVPVRYAGKVQKTVRSLNQRQIWRFPVIEQVGAQGYAPGPSIDVGELTRMQDIYRPRAAAVVPAEHGHPFVNLFEVGDFSADNPVFRFAMSPAVLDRADDYFGGRLRFDSIQVLYSYPTEGQLRESQMWHKDFGDSKSFHCVAYLNDVLDDEHGPFGFVDRADTRRIGASPFIRRISDDAFAEELGPGVVRTFFGKAGDSVFVDPAACYHYGSRCRTPRFAVFVTFNTDRPFVPAVPLLIANAERAVTEGMKVRPDLTEAYLRRILGVA